MPGESGTVTTVARLNNDILRGSDVGQPTNPPRSDKGLSSFRGPHHGKVLSFVHPLNWDSLSVIDEKGCPVVAPEGDPHVLRLRVDRILEILTSQREGLVWVQGTEESKDPLNVNVGLLRANVVARPSKWRRSIAL